MEQYIFILGRDPALSKKELECYCTARDIPFTIMEESDIALVLYMSSINPKQMIKDLGGIQKIAKVIPSFDQLYSGAENKIRYAISNYTGEEEPLQELKAYFKQEKIKATRKKSHHPQRFLTPSEAQGVVEVVLYKTYRAKTIAVFNPKYFKERDTLRPVQRPLHTISIRLAKMLINLTGGKPGDTLLVPFCGIGTIPAEAALMGIDSIGLDKEVKALTACKKNIAWLEKRYKPRGNISFIHGNARQLPKEIQSVDIVATEPYLGPLLKNLPLESEAKKTLKELQPLYNDIIHELTQVTKKTIVLIAPRFLTRSRETFSLSLLPVIKKEGWRAEEPIIYRTPTSRILREIWILHRK